MKYKKILLFLIVLAFTTVFAVKIGQHVRIEQKHAYNASEEESNINTLVLCYVQQNALNGDLEEAENESIEKAIFDRSHRLDGVTVTHYCKCDKCCGKWSDGITASGLIGTPYVTIAVDPNVIPLGSDVLVDYGDGEIHYYRADDTGVKGNHIDLMVNGHKEAIDLGVKEATIWWSN